jgi:hypothetical protein
MTRFLILTDEQEAMLGKLFTGHTRSEQILAQDVRCATCRHWNPKWQYDNFRTCEAPVNHDVITRQGPVFTNAEYACSQWEGNDL